MDHDNLKPDFPNFSEASAAAKVVIDKLRGVGSHTRGCIVKAGWVVTGFAGAQVPDDAVPPVIGETPKDAAAQADMMEVAFSSQGLAGKVDWKSVLKIAIEVLLKLLVVLVLALVLIVPARAAAPEVGVAMAYQLVLLGGAKAPACDCLITNVCPCPDGQCPCTLGWARPSAADFAAGWRLDPVRGILYRPQPVTFTAQPTFSQQFLAGCADGSCGAGGCSSGNCGTSSRGFGRRR